jgi:DNA-binding transcriptional ArsR family regulator
LVFGFPHFWIKVINVIVSIDCKDDYDSYMLWGKIIRGEVAMGAVEAVERAIGGVETRRIILEALLEGEKTGLQLRHSLSKNFDVALDDVSDARLYHNLTQLEEAGIIRRRRDWKVKYAEIVPEMIQGVREHLAVKAPALYIGSIDEDPWVIRRVRQVLLDRSRVNPKKYIFLTTDEMKGKVSGITDDVEIMAMADKIIKHSFDGVYQAVRSLVESNILEYEIVFDVTCGSRFTAMAFFGLAHEFNLRAFYILDDQRLIWIH